MDQRSKSTPKRKEYSDVVNVIRMVLTDEMPSDMMDILFKHTRQKVSIASELLGNRKQTAKSIHEIMEKMQFSQ